MQRKLGVVGNEWQEKGRKPGMGVRGKGAAFEPLVPAICVEEKKFGCPRKGFGPSRGRGLYSLQHTPRGGRSVRGSPVKGKIKRNAEDW